MSADPSVANILATYRTATAAERQDGAAWYAAAHTFCVGLTRRYGVTLEHAAGVVAALSPRLSWAQNLRYAELWLSTGDCPTFLRTKEKLRRLGQGEYLPEVMPKGPKVQAFYACILDPASAREVCVDRHAFDVAHGVVGDDARWKALERKGAYAAMVTLYQKAADTLGVPPHAVQATTWLAWKRTKPYADARHATLYRGAGTEHIIREEGAA